MKKIYLILFCLLIGSTSYTQSYESLFGQNSTMWIFETCNFPGCYQDTAYVVKDTVVDGYIWKKLNLKLAPSSFAGSLIREDTLTGKVWYKALYDYDYLPDTSLQLIFDYSLAIGDTFELGCTWGDPPIENEIVDTVYYINGRKYIGFIQRHLNSGERYTFIEGVGSIFGIFQNHGIVFATSPYLLCSYKDGIQTYTNIKYNGDCDIDYGSSSTSNSFRKPTIKLFPNPVQNVLNIEIMTQKDILRTIKIYNTLGQLFLQQNNANINEALDVSSLPTGIYYIQIIVNDLEIHQQSFFKQ